jgi:hypothetical protein
MTLFPQEVKNGKYSDAYGDVEGGTVKVDLYRFHGIYKPLLCLDLLY